jgi:general secretion pathway protein G
VLQRIRAARQKESGFTLIELLIVIVILGVLAGIVVLAVGAFNERGEEAACKADLKAVEVAVEAYRAKNEAYPADLNALLGGQFLREVPSNTEYTITYVPATGVVTGDLAGGAVTTNCSA